MMTTFIPLLQFSFPYIYIPIISLGLWFIIKLWRISQIQIQLWFISLRKSRHYTTHFTKKGKPNSTLNMVKFSRFVNLTEFVHRGDNSTSPHIFVYI